MEMLRSSLESGLQARRKGANEERKGLPRLRLHIHLEHLTAILLSDHPFLGFPQVAREGGGALVFGFDLLALFADHVSDLGLRQRQRKSVRVE